MVLFLLIWYGGLVHWAHDCLSKEIKVSDFHNELRSSKVFGSGKTLDEVLAQRRLDQGKPWPVQPEIDLLATLPTDLQMALGLTGLPRSEVRAWFDSEFHRIVADFEDPTGDH